MKQLNRIEGSILRLRCMRCDRTFPHFRFSGDTDMVTAGLGSATSCAENEVVLAEMEPSEWNGFEAGGAQAFEQRLSQELGRTDLRVILLLRVKARSPSARGLSFQEFRKQYQPPLLQYSCACCADGASTEVSELTVEEFRNSGGKVTLTGHLTL